MNTDIAKRVVTGLRYGLPTHTAWSCPCGCAHPDEPACARRISDHGELYRRRVAEQRQAEGRAA